MTTDLMAWQNDWRGLMGCFTRPGSAVPCFGPVSKFPLAYLANSLLFGSSLERGQFLLTVTNGLVLALPLAVLALSQGFAMLRRVGWPYLLAIALSPLPMFYVATGALEVQAGVFAGIYIGAFARILASPGLDGGKRTAWVVAVAGFIFPLYKDTAAVLVGVAIVATLAWRSANLRELAVTQDGRKTLLRTALLVGGPVVIGQLFDLGYCWFKYGVPLPLAYMYEAAEAGPSYTKSAEFLAGTLLSPNGGVLFFWSLPLFVAVAGWRVAGLVPQRTVVVLASVVAVVFWLALARWWAAFGWDAWGDRLMVSAMVAVLVALPFSMRSREPQTEPVLRWSVCFACLPLVVYSFYYVAVPYTQSQARSMHDSLFSGPDCTRMGEFLATPQGSAFWRGDVYYSCARERMLYVPRPHTRTH
jgi:hypothetical protein